MNLFTEEQINKIRENLEVFGIGRCLRQIQEECSELAVAISHCYRKDKESALEELLEETADMIICMSQLLMIIDKLQLHSKLSSYITIGMSKMEYKNANPKTE